MRAYCLRRSFMLNFVGSVNFASGATDPGPRVGVVAFSWPPIGCNATIDDPTCAVDNAAPILLNLTSDASLITDTIASRPSSDGLTCISCGIDRGRQVLQHAALARPSAVQMMILLTDGLQTVDGTSQKAVDRANLAKNEGVVVVAVGYGAGDSATIRGMASSPSTSYALESNTLDEFLGGIGALLDTVCLQVDSVCSQMDRCNEPTSVVVHGRGFTDSSELRCCIDSSGGVTTRVFVGAWVDNATVACRWSSPPGVDDPTAGAVLAVEISVDGGSHWTVVSSQSIVTVPCL